MTTLSLSSTFFSHLRYALVVLLICYLPYCLNAPWWILVLILTTITYRLSGHYWGIRQQKIPFIVQLLLSIGCLILLKKEYGTIVSSNFYIGFLLAFIGLKITEIHQERDLKVLIFCNFYLIFAALILIQELWIIFYMMIAILANLSLMLKLHAPAASLKQIGGNSSKQALIALPLCLLLFYVFPRIEHPLWQVPASTQTPLGFGEKMTLDSMLNLANDDRIAFRVVFKDKPILNAYWRGLILSFFNGMSWSPVAQNPANFQLLAPLSHNELAAYEILLEPHQKKWLFYTGYPLASDPALLFSSNQGLVNKFLPIRQRFSYSLKIQPSPIQSLNSNQKASYTQLPQQFNPKINTWAKQRYKELNNDPQAFINFLQGYIRQNSFWYTLHPPALPTVHSMDAFWFDQQKGYCSHYASAISLILRSVGIPARVVIGYQGGEWNPMAGYLKLEQRDAHAWLEYWQEEFGWQQLDPTTFIAPERIDQSILNLQKDRLTPLNGLAYRGSWWQRSGMFFDSARFFIDRWVLFYNQDAQKNLLQYFGFSHWGMKQLLQVSVGIIIVFILLVAVFYQWRQKNLNNQLRVQYHLLQRELRRFNIITRAPATLQQQCELLMQSFPNLSSMTLLFLYHYEQLRLKTIAQNSKENIRQTTALFKQFRQKLKKQRLTKDT